MSSHMTLGIVVGLEMEADIIRAASDDKNDLDNLARPVLAQGYGPQAAGEAATNLIGQGATALLSFGFGGGLGATLNTGDLVVASSVADGEGGSLKADDDWRDGALRLFGSVNAEAGPLLSMSGVAADAACKQDLFIRYGAVAVDMESFAIAEVADESGVPFLALRVILDDAASGIPPSALASVDETGKVSKMKAAAALARRPQDVAAMARLASDSAKASKTLRRVARLGMPLFGLV